MEMLNSADSKRLLKVAMDIGEAMLRSGAGLVKLASVESVVNAVSASVYECTYMCLKSAENGAISAENADMLSEEMNKCTAAAIGCGLSVCDDTKKVVLSAVKNTDIPLIIPIVPNAIFSEYFIAKRFGTNSPKTNVKKEVKI